MVTRIRKLLEQKQLTPTQFADLIGVGRPVMSHILSERNKPSLEVVQRIISAFPELSLPWLLSGVGEMLVESASPAATDSPSGSVAAEALPAAPVAALVTPVAIEPAIPVSVVAPAVEPATPIATFDKPAGAPAMVAPSEAALPPAALAATLAPAAAPSAIKPFRAARFVPPATIAPPPSVVVPVASPAVASPALPGLPTALPSPTVAPADAMLPFLAEPGKAIRRIVIFYRDGSFADYQPEQ